MKKIVYLPLDERPCNNTFCQFLAQNNNEINLVCPPLSILGLKKKPADYQKVATFLTEQCADADYLILAVDMLLFGGLVPSRLHHMDVEEVSSRIEVIKTVKRNNPELKIFVFSLVMRCPTYSSSDEEPDYYEQYGERIFKYGVNEHKYLDGLIDKQEYLSQKALLNVPQSVIEDYTDRRSVNIEVLTEVLKLVGNVIDEFVILQDDSNPYGYTALDQRIIKKCLSDNNIEIDIYPGSDEGGLTLLARVLTKIKGYSPKICPVYPKPECRDVIPLFEDRAVYKSITAQIESAGCTVSEENDADIYLFCNLPVGQMLDFCSLYIGKTNGVDNVANKQYVDRDLPKFVSKLTELHAKGKAVAVADVAYANGGDAEIARMISESVGLLNIAGYAGWNTSSNTLGTVICQTVFYNFFKNTPTHRRFTAERVYEDIAYCSHVRGSVTTNELPKLGYNYFDVGEQRGKVSDVVARQLDEFVGDNFPEICTEYKIFDCYMPWSRMFEVGLTVEEKSDAGYKKITTVQKFLSSGIA